MSIGLGRIALALVAALVLAWLVVLLRDAVLTARVQHVVFERRPSGPTLRRSLRDVRSATLLDPDRSTALSFKAEVYLLEGRRADAVRVYQQMVRDQPRFAEAWFLLAATTPDPSLAARATFEVRRLDPVDRGAAGG